MTTKAIIVAAGRGSRMGPHTDARPKCLVEFAGRPLIEWQIAALSATGVAEIVIVTGYRHTMLEGYGTTRVHNENWGKTNMVFSLLQAKDYLFSGTQTIIAYSDLVYEPHLIQSLIDVPSDIATVIDENWLDLWSARFDDPLCDAETLKLNEDGTLKEIGQKPSSLKEINGQFVGLTKLNQAGARRFVECWDAVRDKTAPQFGNRTADMCYLTDILQRLVDMGESVRSVPVKSGWLEIDSPTDLTVYNDWLENGRLKSFFRTEWSKQ